MADLLAVPSGIKLQVCGGVLVQGGPLHFPTARRSCCWSCKDGSLFSRPAKLMVSERKHASPKWNTRISCSYFSAITDTGGSIASEWIPFADQLLLIASVTLTYMAGVIPFQKPSSDTQVKKPKDDVITENPSFSVVKESDISRMCTWDIVKGKLLDSLATINSGIIPSETLVDIEGSHIRQPSSLSAIAEGPRIRLLWSSFQQLNKEVGNISNEAGKKEEDDFGSVFAAVVQNCCQPLWMAWLEKELIRAPTVSDKDFLSIAGSKMNGYERIIQNIRKTGKEELYAELVYVLKFGGLRKGSYYNSNVFIQHGVEILEDFLIVLADGIASMYLELISVDCGLPVDNDILSLSLCTLSTRALQKLRNEVAVHQWLHQNMQAVVSMFEDQFDLWTFESQPFIDHKGNNIKNPGWWGLKTKRSPPTTFHFVIVKNLSIRVRRTKELRALTGWRYYFSLLLELSDITMPFIRTATSKVRDAISFFLVSLVGRSLGLIFSGIRNALRLK